MGGGEGGRAAAISHLGWLFACLFWSLLPRRQRLSPLLCVLDPVPRRGCLIFYPKLHSTRVVCSSIGNYAIPGCLFFQMICSHDFCGIFSLLRAVARKICDRPRKTGCSSEGSRVDQDQVHPQGVDTGPRGEIRGLRMSGMRLSCLGITLVVMFVAARVPLTRPILVYRRRPPPLPVRVGVGVGSVGCAAKFSGCFATLDATKTAGRVVPPKLQLR